MTTPVINHPEVAIVGVNKMAVRPVWDGHGFVPRKMMNLSSSFDHRVIDGWDAAVFVQRLKALLETPGDDLPGGLSHEGDLLPSSWSSAPAPAATSAPSAPASSASTR